MCVVSGADQEFRIQSVPSSVRNIRFIQGIHVMNNHTSVDFIAFDSQIATKVSGNNVSAETTPFSRRIELLIDPSVESECLTAYFALQSKIFIPFDECIELYQL